MTKYIVVCRGVDTDWWVYRWDEDAACYRPFIDTTGELAARVAVDNPSQLDDMFS